MLLCQFTPMMLQAIVCAFVFLLASVSAVPLRARDVVDPPITNPTASTIWQVGTTQTVTWDTSSLPPPANITNKIGLVALGYLTTDSENLDLNNPLAQGFPITQGSVNIVVPDVPPRTNYIIVLMGDSGNISPEFSIVGGSAASSSSSSAASSTPSSTPASSSPTGTGTGTCTPTSTSPAAAATPTTPASSSTPGGPSPNSLTNNSPLSASSASGSAVAVPFGSSTSTSTATAAATSLSGKTTNAAWSWKQATPITAITFAFMTTFLLI